MIPSSFILNSLIALLPILGWIYFFQKQKPEKKAYVVYTFLAGMIAVFPIKLYERYLEFSVWKFEHLSLFKYLSDLAKMPSLPKFLGYLTMDILVAAGLFIFVALLMFVLEVFSKDNTIDIFKKKFVKILESPLFFISVGLICGIIAYFSSFSIHKSIWFFVVVGMLEEFVKHLVLRFSDEEKIKSIDDALEFSILVALGFAFVENILYFQSSEYVGKTFSLFVLSRSTISVMAHICFSAVFGYFYGVAKFSSAVYKQENEKKKHPFIEILHKILHLKGETLFHEEKMMVGMLSAMGLHAFFNSLLEFGKSEWVIPFVVFLFFVVLHLFHKKDLALKNKVLIQPITS